jgi:dTDP-4-dehydrorhamnose 3,5-epimerase
MFERYSPEHARGLRFDDPRLAIEWPLADPIVSDRDRSFDLISG